MQVIECSWDKLVNNTKDQSNDLDQFIEEHNNYLRNIIEKGLLKTSSDNASFI
jgi:gamma-tubulin complex component 3